MLTVLFFSWESCSWALESYCSLCIDQIQVCLYTMNRSLLEGISDAILMNLPQDSFYYIIIAITMLITLWGSYPLLLLPCFQILETKHRVSICIYSQ